MTQVAVRPKMASFTELADLVKVALGTPEIVNFKALNKVLTGIVNRLAALCGKVETVKEGKEDQTPRKKTRSVKSEESWRQPTSQHGDEAKEDDEKRKKTRKTTKHPSDSAKKTNRGQLDESPSSYKDSDEPQSKTKNPTPRAKKAESATKRVVSTSQSSDTAKEDTVSGESSMSKEDKKKDKGRKLSRKSSTKIKVDQPSEEKDVQVSEVQKSSSDSERKDTEKDDDSKEEVEGADDEENIQDEAEIDPDQTTKSKRTSSGSLAGKESTESAKGREAKRDSKKKSSDEDAGSVEEVTSLKSDTAVQDEHLSDEDLQEGFFGQADAGNYVTKQDFDDVVQRVHDLEKGASKKKAPSRGENFVDRDEFNKLSYKEKALEKLVDIVEKKADEEIAEIRQELIEINSQLQYLPRLQEMYRSYFPSWKMLEDSLCSHPTLKENITEVKQWVENEDPAAKNKQLPKFLGVPGPSDRLLSTLEALGRLCERSQQSSFDLTSEVAQAKVDTSAKRASMGNQAQAQRQSSDARQSQRSSIVTVESDSMDTMPPVASPAEPDQSRETIEKAGSISAAAPGPDAGYLGFKIAKLAEQSMGLRKEVDDMQHWKDKLGCVENDIKQLADLMVNMKKDLEVKEEKDHEILTNLQMDMSEFHTEIFSRETQKTMQTRRDDMASFRERVQEEDTPRLPGGLVIDREARIRTQQLQMQVNAMNQMISELEANLPTVQYSPAPTGLPEDIQHPWGTGRGGAGTTMRAGVGTTATAVSPPTPRVVSKTQISRGGSPQVSPRGPFRPDVRPSPLGSTEDRVGGQPGVVSPERAKVAGKAVQIGQVMLRPSDTGKLQEENTKMQHAITRLNAAHNAMAAKVECCQNQIISEVRRLQDLMSRMHREGLTRFQDLQEHVTAVLEEDYKEFSADDGTQSRERSISRDRTPAVGRDEGKRDSVGKGTADDGSAPALPAGGPQGQEGEGQEGGGQEGGGTRQRTASLSSPSSLNVVRKELMSYIRSLRKRVTALEGGIPIFGAQDAEAALLKRPLVRRFQCLACDKRVELGQHRGSEGGAVPSSLPELPRLPPLTSPPRLRNSKSGGGPVKPIDMYEIPRQCGGSYTSSCKPRRVHYYSNLGEVVDGVVEQSSVQRVDVKGSDGHIYKGQI